MGGWCRRGQLNLLALCCLCLVGGQKEAPREELQAPMLSSSTVLIPRGMATVLQVVVKFSHVTDEKKVEPPTRPPKTKVAATLYGTLVTRYSLDWEGWGRPEPRSVRVAIVNGDSPRRPRRRGGSGAVFKVGDVAGGWGPEGDGGSHSCPTVQLCCSWWPGCEVGCWMLHLG